MSYGGGPFGATPYGSAPVTFDNQLQPELHSSCKLDGVTKEWQLDPVTNAQLGMDDIHQRVLLLISYADNDKPLIDDGYELKLRRAILDALRPLTEVKPPLIRVDRVTVERGPNLTMYKHVVFTRLEDGTQTSVGI